MSRYTERTYSPDRLLHPMRRIGPKGSGAFEASAGTRRSTRSPPACGQLPRAIRKRILPYSYAGTMGLVQGESMAARFFNRLGASLLDRTICSSAGKTGLMYTLGGPVGMDVERFPNRS